MDKLKNIEIYQLASEIDKMDEKSLEINVKVTVDLEKPLNEQKKLENLNYVTPIKEAEKFRLIRRGEIAKKILSEEPMLIDEVREALEIDVERMNSAIEFLVEKYRPSARFMAKNWIHDDRLNKIGDWFGIIDLGLMNAISTFDLNAGTQFNTHLKYKVMEVCKESKCDSAIVSSNASAFQKARDFNKAKERIAERGEDPSDIYILAKEVGRDISTPNKLRNFRMTVMDCENISPQGFSIYSQIDEHSRTLEESLDSGVLSPSEMLEFNETKKEFINFIKSLSKSEKECLKKNLGLPYEGKYNDEKVLKRLRTRETEDLIARAIKFSNIENLSFLLTEY